MHLNGFKEMRRLSTDDALSRITKKYTPFLHCFGKKKVGYFPYDFK